MPYFPVHGSDRQVIQLKTHAPFVLFCAAEVPPLNTHCTIPYFEIGHYQCKNKLSLTSFNVLLKYSYFQYFLLWFTDFKDLRGHLFKSRVIRKTPADASQKILVLLTTVKLKAVSADFQKLYHRDSMVFNLVLHVKNSQFNTKL